MQTDRMGSNSPRSRLVTHTSLVMQQECQFKSKATEITFSVLGKATKISESLKRETQCLFSLK